MPSFSAFVDRFPSAHNLQFKNQDWPTIDEQYFRQIYESGGQYCGYVERRPGRRFEDIWISRWSYYDLLLEKLVSAWVYTAAMTVENHKAPQEPTEIAKYITTFVVRDMLTGKVLDGDEILHMYDRKTPLIEMAGLAEMYHVALEGSLEHNIGHALQLAEELMPVKGMTGRIL